MIGRMKHQQGWELLFLVPNLLAYLKFCNFTNIASWWINLSSLFYLTHVILHVPIKKRHNKINTLW
jgi:hypothetical protein